MAQGGGEDQDGSLGLLHGGVADGYGGWPGHCRRCGMDSFLLSSVQMAPLASQSVVSGRVMLTAPLPVGFTSTFQPWLLPWGDPAGAVYGGAADGERVVLDAA